MVRINELVKKFSTPAVEAPKALSPEFKLKTQADSVSDSTRCGECGGKHFWRWKTRWFCAKCRIPPNPSFVEDERGGTGMRPVVQSGQLLAGERLIANECNWAREVCCKTDGCKCRMVKETAFSDGTFSLNCFVCGAVAVSDFDL